MKAPQIVIGIAAALILAGGGFAAGMTFDKSQSPTTTTGATGATGARGGSGARGAFGGGGGTVAGQQPVTGRILAVNDGSITVAAVERGQGGANAQASASPATSSQIVLVGTTTRILKTTGTDSKRSALKGNDQGTLTGTTATSGGGRATATAL